MHQSSVGIPTAEVLRDKQNLGVSLTTALIHSLSEIQSIILYSWHIPQLCFLEFLQQITDQGPIYMM